MNTLIRISKYTIALSIFFLPATARSTINVGLSGFGSTSNAGLESYTSNSGTVSVSLGLLNHLRVGVNHRRQFEDRKGLKEISRSTGTVYLPFKSKLDSSTYSVNLTVVLYNGIVSPYVFGGMANKYYTSKFVYDLDVPQTDTTKFELLNVPTYGFGFAFFINKNFSLKTSQTFSEGKTITVNPDGEKEEATPIDSYTQVGITYTMR